MRNKFIRFIELSICLLLSSTLLFGAVNCFDDLFEHEEFQQREVEDFVVRFYKDRCEICGTTRVAKQKKFLVIPEYLYGIRVASMGYTSWNGTLDMQPGDLTFPEIQSERLEKIYFESAIDSYAWMGEEYIGCNFKKIMYPEINEYLSRFHSIDTYFPRSVYEKAIEDEKISRYDRKYPVNVSYYYNYENAKKNGYYWIDDCDYGGKIEFIPPEPKREEYTFDGWYEEPECINKWDFEVDTLPEEKKEEIDADDKTVTEAFTVYQETILYAKWV